MDSQHTETPWWYQEKSDSYTHILRSGGNRFVCQFGSEATARRVLACVNAFHDPAGRTIATEDISEGCVFRLRDALSALMKRAGVLSILDDDEREQHQALLSSLKVQGPET